MIKIKQGLDLPIAGQPMPTIAAGASVSRVSVLGADYHGVKPTMAVAEGDYVKLGQVLFADKRCPEIKFTAPGAGTVTHVHRGQKRVLLGVEIALDDNASESFQSYNRQQAAALGRSDIVAQLLASGMWTALRTRPFSHVPDPASEPAAIFVSAMDTNPLALDPLVVLDGQAELLATGLKLLKKLTPGPVYVVKRPEVFVPGAETDGVEVRSFAGPHPAGLVGTHIHFLLPASAKRTVWHIGYQDVLAIAKLFLTGKLDVERVVSLAGPQVEQPRYLRTRLGADLVALTQGELKAGDNRIVSGSVLSGRRAAGPFAFLGRYHTQVSVLREGREHEFLGWLSVAGGERHSALNIYLSKLMPGRRFNLSTALNGSQRAMVPVGTYEDVMPLDILPTQLLRALLVDDSDSAQELGCLELDEEDLALCTYVCPGKYDYGPLLRRTLARIEKEG